MLLKNIRAFSENISKFRKHNSITVVTPANLGVSTTSIVDSSLVVLEVVDPGLIYSHKYLKKSGDGDWLSRTGVVFQTLTATFQFSSPLVLHAV